MGVNVDRGGKTEDTGGVGRGGQEVKLLEPQTTSPGGLGEEEMDSGGEGLPGGSLEALFIREESGG